MGKEVIYIQPRERLDVDITGTNKGVRSESSDTDPSVPDRAPSIKVTVIEENGINRIIFEPGIDIGEGHIPF